MVLSLVASTFLHNKINVDKFTGDIGLTTVKVTWVDRFYVYHGSCATRHNHHRPVAWVAL